MLERRLMVLVGEAFSILDDRGWKAAPTRLGKNSTLLGSHQGMSLRISFAQFGSGSSAFIRRPRLTTATWRKAFFRDELDPRLILKPEDLKITRRLMRLLKTESFKITLDQAFGDVIRECASVKRQNQNDTWITNDMIEAYCHLHQEGFAHSVESCQDGELAGGLYGISLGNAFFGESMFSRVSNASKIAFVHVVWFLESENCSLVDCQLTTQHLLGFGAREVPRKEFLSMLGEALKHKTKKGRWQLSEGK